MTKNLFLDYQARGLATRDDAIITAQARGADPLSCIGETFGTSGTLANWVVLNQKYARVNSDLDVTVQDLTPRVAHPLGLFYWGKVWTVVAWCERRAGFGISSSTG